jgi:hypothetical protein
MFLVHRQNSWPPSRMLAACVDEEDKRLTVVRISDNGSGIPDDEVAPTAVG